MLYCLLLACAILAGVRVHMHVCVCVCVCECVGDSHRPTYRQSEYIGLPYTEALKSPFTCELLNNMRVRIL